MKSYLLKAIVLIAVFFAPCALNAQTITGHWEADSCKGNVAFKITGLSIPGTMSVNTFFGDGDSTTNPASAILGPGIHHVYLTPGTFTVKHVLVNGGVAIDSIQFTMTKTLCSHVMVKLYKDMNSNCIFDTGEPVIQSTSAVEIDSAGVKIDTLFVNAYTYVPLTQGKTYTFKLLTPPLGTISTCPSNGIITMTVPISMPSPNVDFGVQCGSSSQYDLAITRVEGRHRPVSYSYVHVSATNNSCTPLNAVLSATFSNKYSYVTAFPAPTSVSGNVVTWNLNSFSSTSQIWTTVVLVPATTVSLGDTICSSASISPTSGDINTTNNSKSSCDSVKASWDPNTKEVSPAGAIMPGTKLDYTINFENLGNDTAFNIHIMDTLSDNVDPNSFVMTASSHRASSSLLTGTNGKRIIRFEFPDINLADSSHKESNKGFVKFNINAKTGLAPLTQIENRAGIYFDINPVVMTNTALNWIIGVGIDEVGNSKPLHIYPNPNDGQFIIKADVKEYNTAKLMNSLGQVLVSQALTGNETKMNVKVLPSGIYYMLLTGPAGNTAERIEKQ